MVRESFEYKLSQLKQQVMRMNTLAKQALKKSIQALDNQDLQKAQEVIDGDKEINDLEDKINDTTIWLIAKEQPVATDLRRLIVTLKVTNDIERIGDLAVNVAKSVERIGQEPLPDYKNDVLVIGNHVEIMMDEVIHAFVEEDLEYAYKIAELDDQVDRKYGHTVQNLMKHMAENPKDIEAITQLAFISRYLERTGDHITNIAEGIIYLVKGKHVDLNT
ncbi:phosphate signaling complex protein PhoU [Halalkalibacillus halophilus]|uniref:phosphate signaling complex protein PhoU n=1 Tax=Halalkalibacillus halophilus TaxID=392827 RepID=UPI0004085389|nr:phosphate signaling complex protein PhoU [Halalkalibacillus halophilus]